MFSGSKYFLIEVARKEENAMDWVHARIEWAPEPAWAALQKRVEQDVTGRNEVSLRTAGCG